MMAIKTLMENRAVFPLLLFPWILMEIFEVGVYIFKPEQEFKPSFKNSFCWCKLVERRKK